MRRDGPSAGPFAVPAVALAAAVALVASIALAALVALAPAGCAGGGYDPTLYARASSPVVNAEAPVPLACYAKTGAANTCWTCHTEGQGPNHQVDFELQRQYSFSDLALENHWASAFVDRSAAVAQISDDEILAWVRGDNYGALRRAMGRLHEHPGWVPDLDFARGFDDLGFAADGTGWRAFRYQPFPGMGWPTNGSAGDAFVRLPRPFRVDREGRDSIEIYRVNLAILEAAIAADPRVLPAALDRDVEPVDESAAGVDLDGDGVLLAGVSRLRGLPERYAGGAANVLVRRWQYPLGAELLHTVRYLDPDAPALLSRRMKEVRYARKVEVLDDWANARAYEREAEEKQEGHLPVHTGSPRVGLRNAFGWQLTGFIEDRLGRLRLQTEEEHRACMGCHSGVGVTVDHTFSLARKVPGAEGWRHQDLRGMCDVPQAGHADPEALTYLRRAGRADDFGANDEMVARFFDRGRLDEAAVRRAAHGGDRDLAWLLAPSRERALLLDKAYRALVATQRFAEGRDAFVAPPPALHRTLAADAAAADRVHVDGRLHLAWE